MHQTKLSVRPWQDCVQVYIIFSYSWVAVRLYALQMALMLYPALTNRCGDFLMLVGHAKSMPSVFLTLPEGNTLVLF